ncbi:hypothetical protein OAS39_10610 [Pirellulales bacterium]|nr:hypothetical protein [Pirellulales bacterium]
MWYGVGQYLCFAAVVSLVMHIGVRQYIIACVAIVVVSSLANMLHEAWLVDFDVNIGWAPFMFVAGVLLASPIACIVGLPFVYLRRSA